MTVEDLEPPQPGTEDWGDDLNAYLAHLEGRIIALESKPDYVYSSFAWTYSTGSPPPAINGQVRCDATDLTTVTMIEFRKIDGDGADRTNMFRQMRAGSKVRLSDWDTASISHRWNITGDPVFNTDTVQLPVSWETGSGALSNNSKLNVAFLTELVY